MVFRIVQDTIPICNEGHVGYCFQFVSWKEGHCVSAGKRREWEEAKPSEGRDARGLGDRGGRGRAGGEGSRECVEDSPGSIVRRKLLRGSTHAESVTPSTSTSSSSRASAASCLPPPSHFERVSAFFIDISFLLIYSHKPLQMSLLLQLPTELLVKIISSLDWRTLLACRKVGFLLTPSCITNFRSIL